VSKPDDQTEGDRISFDKTKTRDIKPAQNNEVDNYKQIISNYNEKKI